MALSKYQLRDLLMPSTGSHNTLYIDTATNDQIKFTSYEFTNQPNDKYKGWYIVFRTPIGAAPYIRPYARVSKFDGNTGTFIAPTIDPSNKNGLIAELHRVRPDMYTRAVNEAIRTAYPLLFSPVLDNSLTVLNNITQYNLPAGVTWNMVRSVMIEGSDSYAGMPYYYYDDVTSSPDGAKLWFAAMDKHKMYFMETGKKIYLLLEKPLTPLDEDVNFGGATDANILLNDEVAKVELTLNSGPLELLLLYAKWALFNFMQANPDNPNADNDRQTASYYLSQAKQMAPNLKMPRLATSYT